MPPRLALPPSIQHEVTAALHEARQNPAHRSLILGDTALGLAARSASPAHRADAKVLRAVADRLAHAALSSGALLGGVSEEGTAFPGAATRDDFQETLEDFDQANAEHAYDLHAAARADDLNDARSLERSPRMSIAPVAWGAGATLGRSGKFKYDPTSDEVAQNIAASGTLAYWQGESHEAQAITVDLGLPAGQEPPPRQFLQIVTFVPPPRTKGVSSRARGIISYGSDGAVTRVVVDANFGTRLQVLGNYVAVQVVMEPPRAGEDAGLMAYTASIGAFASPSKADVFYTAYIDRLTAGSSTDGFGTPPPIQRPSHAAAILAIYSNQITGTATLNFFGQGAKGSLFSFPYKLGTMYPPLPLPSDVQYIVLTNNTGQTANFNIVFQLAL